jgi:hypothetical protein
MGSGAEFAGSETVDMRIAIAGWMILGFFAACGGSNGGSRASQVQPSFAVHGCYGKDSSPTGFDHLVSAHCNVIDRPAFREDLDALPSGVKGMVWVGNYDNSICDWQKSDDWIRSHLAAIKGHPAIAMYYLADVPHIWDCPTLPQQMKARSDLVHSIDPGPPTFVLIEPRANENPYAPYVGTTDIIGADRYPCSYKDGCVMSLIDDTIALLEDAHAPRYWASLQAFADSTHRMPTPDELREEFRRWGASRADGVLAFSWNFGTDTLDNHPELVAVLTEENSG